MKRHMLALLAPASVVVFLIAAAAILAARWLGLEVGMDGTLLAASGVVARPLKNRIEDNGLAKVAVGFAAFGAAIAVFFGLRTILGTATLEGWVVPFVAAVVIAYTIYALWHKMLDVAPLIRNPNRKALVVTVAILLTVVTICISSWFIATSIGGTPALQHHAAVSLEDYKASFRIAYSNALAARALVPEIITKAGEFEAMARLERQNGFYTGSSGPGEVESALDMFAATLRATAQNMERSYQRVETLHQEGTRTIAKMQRLVSTRDGSIEERQQRFNDLSVSLQTTLVEMQKEDPLEILAQGAIGGLVTISQQLSVSQRGAIQQLNSQVEDWGNELRRRARDAQDSQEPVEPITFVPMNAGLATATYASKIPGAWAVGIGIDLVPLILLLILMLGHAETNQDAEDEAEHPHSEEGYPGYEPVGPRFQADPVPAARNGNGQRRSRNPRAGAVEQGERRGR